MKIRIKNIIYALLVSVSLVCVAQAELRTIAIEVSKNSKGKVVVNLHSEVDSEKKTGISVALATKILQVSKGWGSSVGVAIQAEGVTLSEYLPLVTKISENMWLDLEGLSSSTGIGYEHIMKHYKVRQTTGLPVKIRDAVKVLLDKLPYSDKEKVKKATQLLHSFEEPVLGVVETVINLKGEKTRVFSYSFPKIGIKVHYHGNKIIGASSVRESKNMKKIER